MLPGIGIFGTSPLVRLLISYLQSKGFPVAALWAPTSEEAEQLALECGVQTATDSVDDLLLNKHVELVFILCSPILHSQISVKALGIGKHVLCDRPAALCQMEAFKMVNAALYYPSLVSILNHGLRFLPAFIQMKKAIREGYVGEVRVCDVRVHCGPIIEGEYNWLCDERMGGGVLAQIGCHVIDIITYVMEERAVRVHGSVRTFLRTTDKINGIRQITSDDFCTFQMEMEKGAFVTVTLNTHMNGHFNQEVLVCGTEGRLCARGGDLYGQKRCSNKEEPLYLDVEDLQVCTLTPLVPKLYIKGLFKLVSALKEAFSDRKAFNPEPLQGAGSFQDGQYVGAVMDSIRLSSKTRNWVRVALLQEEPVEQGPQAKSVISLL